MADYTNCKEKMLVRKVHGITISGITAWGVSFMMVVRSITEVRGVEYLLGSAFVFFYTVS